MKHCPIHQRDFDGDDMCPDCKGEMAAECSGLDSCTPNSELRTLTAGCLLCLRFFKNDHGVSIHVGKIHNKRPPADDSSAE